MHTYYQDFEHAALEVWRKYGVHSDVVDVDALAERMIVTAPGAYRGASVRSNGLKILKRKMIS